MAYTSNRPVQEFGIIRSREEAPVLLRLLRSLRLSWLLLSSHCLGLGLSLSLQLLLLSSPLFLLPPLTLSAIVE